MIREKTDIERGKDNAVDYATTERRVGFMDEDDGQAQMQGSNLSMDEVRRSLDEYEKILRA